MSFIQLQSCVTTIVTSSMESPDGAGCGDGDGLRKHEEAQQGLSKAENDAVVAGLILVVTRKDIC